MGLDIYLYEAAHEEQNRKHDAEWSALYERKDRGEITEAEYDDLRTGITQWASHVSVPSERYPSHLFNRRYLRSSYNGGGFNRAVPDMVGDDHSLYWIFEPLGREWDGDEGKLTETDVAALNEARKRAEQVADELRSADPLRVSEATALIGIQEHLWQQPPTEDEVLRWYRDERERWADRDSDGGYSTAKGTVLGFTDGLEVLAVTLGRNIIGQPAAMFVYRLDREALNSYVQSAEITAEFIDEAIGLIERDGSVYMSWSG